MRRLILISSLMLLAAACGSSSNNPVDAGTDAGTDAGSGDGGPDLNDGGCYATPSATNSFEIINACTDAGFVDKHPALPLLLSDGGLPPLP